MSYVDPEQTREVMRRRLAEHSREDFTSILAQMLSEENVPSDENWRDLAQKDPEKWTRALKTAANLAGFADRTEHVTKTYDMTKIAETLLARHGQENLLQIWQSMGLPVSQLPEQIRPAIEHSEDEKAG